MLRPLGFATVTPYMFVEGAELFVQFLVDGFGAREIGRTMDDGRVANAQVMIGDASVMVTEAGRGIAAMPASYYLYVDDADAAMARAKHAGATEILAVQNMPYGDRQGGVRDPNGNLWWISQRLVDEEYY